LRDQFAANAAGELELLAHHARQAGLIEAANRWRPHREQRYKRLLQCVVTIAEADLAEIASCGYPDVMSDDKVRSAQALGPGARPRRSAQALGLFISDTVACLDTQR
jgi:hypothetical protein